MFATLHVNIKCTSWRFTQTRYLHMPDIKHLTLILNLLPQASCNLNQTSIIRKKSSNDSVSLSLFSRAYKALSLPLPLSLSLPLSLPLSFPLFPEGLLSGSPLCLLRSFSLPTYGTSFPFISWAYFTSLSQQPKISTYGLSRFSLTVETHSRTGLSKQA